MRKQFLSLFKTCVCGVMLLAGVVSCEKMNLNDADDGSRANVVLRIGSIEQIPFPVATRATIEELCSHLCFHIYDDTGIRVDYVNQKVEDSNYGTASFMLDKGHYYLVVVGHSGSKNPSFSANEKVSISGDNLGDTFWCSKDFEVGDDNVNLDLELQRIVSLLQFVPIATPPANLDHIVFKYKGSKGTFNGLTGYGSTTASQSVKVMTSSDASQYEFYMIPRAEEDMIDISMMAYDSEIRGLGGCSIDEVPVKRNRITICRGNLFDGGDNSASVFVSVTINDSWGDNILINI